MSSRMQSFTKDRVMIMSAPNGARRTRRDHPALPITPDELANNAVALRNAGVSVLHLHVRDRNGKHTLDADCYQQAIAAIQQRVGDELVIQVTTESVGLYTPMQQMDVVRDLRPEAVSLALREICPKPADETTAAEFFAWMRTEHIWPQLILYNSEDVSRFDALRCRGVFADETPFVLYVLGNYADSINGQLADLEEMRAATVSAVYPWAVCCFGRNEIAVMCAAAESGGHVRIGFENNLELPDGTQAADNAALIRAFLAANMASERSAASANEVRSAFAPRLQ